MTRRIIELYLRSLRASTLRNENSEEDKPGEVWNDIIGCAISRDARVKHSVNNHEASNRDRDCLSEDRLTHC
eukprot:2846344-Karenia_brevis.AAC.1